MNSVGNKFVKIPKILRNKMVISHVNSNKKAKLKGLFSGGSLSYN